MIVRLGLLLLAVAAATPVRAQAPGSDDKPPPADQVIDLGAIRVNRTRQFVEVKGQISLERGLVELLACTPEGKAYESILVLDCRADMLQTGLVLLGLERGVSGRRPGDKMKAKGSPVEVVISWEDPKAKAPRRYLAEDLVWDQRGAKTMKRVGWVFVGSRFARNAQTQREVFMASVTGTLAVTYHDPDAILDTPLEAGGDDSTFYANHHILPPRGTPIVVRIYAQKAYADLPAADRAMAVPEAAAEANAPGSQAPPEKPATPPAGSGSGESK